MIKRRCDKGGSESNVEWRQTRDLVDKGMVGHLIPSELPFRVCDIPFERFWHGVCWVSGGGLILGYFRLGR